jgi:hypothetical protein
MVVKVEASGKLDRVTDAPVEDRSPSSALHVAARVSGRPNLVTPAAARAPASVIIVTEASRFDALPAVAKVSTAADRVTARAESAVRNVQAKGHYSARS